MLIKRGAKGGGSILKENVRRRIINITNILHGGPAYAARIVFILHASKISVAEKKQAFMSMAQVAICLNKLI